MDLKLSTTEWESHGVMCSVTRYADGTSCCLLRVPRGHFTFELNVDDVDLSFWGASITYVANRHPMESEINPDMKWFGFSTPLLAEPIPDHKVVEIVNRYARLFTPSFITNTTSYGYECIVEERGNEICATISDTMGSDVTVPERGWTRVDGVGYVTDRYSRFGMSPEKMLVSVKKFTRAMSIAKEINDETPKVWWSNGLECVRMQHDCLDQLVWFVVIPPGHYLFKQRTTMDILPWGTVALNHYVNVGDEEYSAFAGKWLVGFWCLRNQTELSSFYDELLERVAKQIVDGTSILVFELKNMFGLYYPSFNDKPAEIVIMVDRSHPMYGKPSMDNSELTANFTEKACLATDYFYSSNSAYANSVKWAFGFKEKTKDIDALMNLTNAMKNMTFEGNQTGESWETSGVAGDGSDMWNTERRSEI